MEFIKRQTHAWSYFHQEKKARYVCLNEKCLSNRMVGGHQNNQGGECPYCGKKLTLERRIY
jgi:DNA-directed RNA polymerase subunit RPC12/RpoP